MKEVVYVSFTFSVIPGRVIMKSYYIDGSSHVTYDLSVQGCLMNTEIDPKAAMKSQLCFREQYVHYLLLWEDPHNIWLLRTLNYC